MLRRPETSIANEKSQAIWRKLFLSCEILREKSKIYLYSKFLISVLVRKQNLVKTTKKTLALRSADQKHWLQTKKSRHIARQLVLPWEKMRGKKKGNFLSSISVHARKRNLARTTKKTFAQRSADKRRWLQTKKLRPIARQLVLPWEKMRGKKRSIFLYSISVLVQKRNLANTTKKTLAPRSADQKRWLQTKKLRPIARQLLLT